MVQIIKVIANVNCRITNILRGVTTLFADLYVPFKTFAGLNEES